VRIYQVLCVIQGLRFLHKIDLIHGFFLLDNILIKYENETGELFLKILNFGFSKIYFKN
jgi:serine/threonine protein kinase